MAQYFKSKYEGFNGQLSINVFELLDSFKLASNDHERFNV